jgi:hypothetical protein
VGPRAGLDVCGKVLPATGVRSPDRPARSESLYRLIIHHKSSLNFTDVVLHNLCQFSSDCMASRTDYSISTPQKPTLFDGQYLRNRKTLDIGVLG